MNTESADEVWKDIDFIPEKDGSCAYQVSNLGRVRRAKEVVSDVDVKGLGIAGFTGKYKRRLKPKMLKLNNTYTRHGKQRYSFVSIKDVTYAVHTLVAKTFLADTNRDGLVVNHKDGNKHNNCVDNLEWVTQSENEHHSYRVLGKQVWNKGTKGLMPKYWSEKRKNKNLARNKEIFEKFNNGVSAIKLGKEYGLNRNSIYNILKGFKTDE